jgi:DNA-binding LacI/PurR family transcriptional regulator
MNRQIPLSEAEPARPPRRPTIFDVARRAGVSPTLVSFAINGRTGVADDTRARILDAVKELGWRPSASARALTEARTRTIGLVLARDVEQLELDSFFVRFLSGVERTLAHADHALLLQLIPAADRDAVLSAYERLAGAGRVDGFLLTDPELDDPRLALLEAAGMPAVIAGRPIERTRFRWVETEHDLGVLAAVEHLAGLGHERIAFLGASARYEHVQRRLSRWREALAAAALQPGRIVHANGDLAAAATAVLETEPTGVVCTSDTLALALTAAARDRGLDVPGQISVIGFDDSLLAALSSPALTSVRVDYAQFGAAASKGLLAVLADEDPPAYAPAPPELIVRASTSGPQRT